MDTPDTQERRAQRNNPVSFAPLSPVNPSQIIDIPDRINIGLSSAKRATMVSILGMPRDSFDGKCRDATNEPTRSLLVTEDVGPFRVRGIGPAVASLRQVLSKVKTAHPEVYASIGTAGMFCARLIDGSTNPSNHSWGCAVDISINGTLDGLVKKTRKDGKTLAGLAAMASLFNEAGWYWGVGFSNFEDGMHFEVADETIRKWHADGALGKVASTRSVPEVSLSIGDRGKDVKTLQSALAALGFDIIPDGAFGQITHSIVMDFQASRGLVPDGIVGKKTRSALGL